MKLRTCLFVTMLTAVPHFALAQAGTAGGAALNNAQLEGRRIFTQSCGVCHTKPTITSNQYGPVLSKDSLDGQDEAINEVVSDGTQRMPGFKYTYSPEQISDIVAYIKTIPAPAAAAATPAAK